MPTTGPMPTANPHQAAAGGAASVPGVFATSMPSSCKTSSRLFHINNNASEETRPAVASSATTTSSSTTTSSCSTTQATTNTEDHTGKLNNNNTSRKRSHQDPTTGSSSMKNGPPLKVTIRRTAQQHSSSPTGVRHASPEAYMCEKHPSSTLDTSTTTNGDRSFIASFTSPDSHHHTPHTHHHNNPDCNNATVTSSAKFDYSPSRVNSTATNGDGKLDEESCSANSFSKGTCTLSSATITEPDLLGPCEPGSRVLLDGVVWIETPGMLVLNVNWRGRSYVGSLIDATKNSMGPSCPDKSINSLTLMRSRNWKNGGGGPGGGAGGAGSGLHRNRVSAGLTRPGLVSPRMHHYHHYHLAGIGSGSSLHGSVTTRSASAAAANSTGDQAQPSTPELHHHHHRPGKRGKRKNLIMNTSATSNAAEMGSEQTPSTPDGHQIQQQLSHSYHLPLKCPIDNCDKRFTNMLSLRFHTQMGHQAQQQKITKKLTRRSLLDSSRSVHVRKRRKQTTTTSVSSSSVVQSPPGKSFWSNSKPPKLAKVSQTSEEQAVAAAAAGSKFASATQTLPQQQTQQQQQQQTKPQQPPQMQTQTSLVDDELPPKLEEEPATARSPAYSDISDDDRGTSMSGPPTTDLLITAPTLLAAPATTAAFLGGLSVDLASAINCNRPWLSSPTSSLQQSPIVSSLMAPAPSPSLFYSSPLQLDTNGRNSPETSKGLLVKPKQALPS